MITEKCPSCKAQNEVMEDEKVIHLCGGCGRFCCKTCLTEKGNCPHCNHVILRDLFETYLDEYDWVY